jgi:hypothetical protein
VKNHRLLLIVMLPALLGACTVSHAPKPGSNPNALLEILQDARASGKASARQIEILEHSAATGALPFEVYAEAVNSTLSCFDTAGIPYKGPFTDEALGFKQLLYAGQAGSAGTGLTITGDNSPDSETLITKGDVPANAAQNDPKGLLAESCRYENSAFVEAGYTSQPSSVQAQDSILEKKRADVLKCASQEGLALDESLPIRKLLAQLLDYGEPGRKCMRQNDVTSF